MENPKTIVVHALTTRRVDKEDITRIVKDYLSDKVEYFDGCIEVELYARIVNKKSFWIIELQIDDHIALDIYSSFGPGEDDEDEVLSVHQLVRFFREGLADFFQENEEWAIYQDDFCDELCRVAYQEINELENSLRAVLSFIFVVGTGELRDFLNSSKVSVLGDYKEDAALKYQQTQLHYLSFADYKNIGDSRSPKIEHLIGGLKDSQSFDEFRDSVFPELLQEQAHKDFITSLIQIMDPIEKVRNAIAHNRLPSVTHIDNYVKSRDLLRKAIEDFWKTNEFEES